MKYKNLIILGTSHIAKESVEQVEKLIKSKDPDIVALELDKRRFFALLSEKKGGFGFSDIWKLGVKGFLFGLIGHFVEHKLGKYVGVKPGTEMLTAIKLVRERKKNIALIDQDITITLKKFSKTFGWREKWNLFKDIVKAIFARKKEIPFDLRKVPSKAVIKKMMKEVKEKYPSVYRVLIEERNVVMARNLSYLMKKHPDSLILAIIGAGHEEEIIRLIKESLAKGSEKI